MSLINSEDYSDISGASNNTYKKIAKRFTNIFITGEMRDNQSIGKMQCMSDFDNEKYILNNVDQVNFLPLYVKRIWEKHEDVPGQKWSKLVAFSWDPNRPKIDDKCKFSYIIAGCLLDENMKTMEWQEDQPDNGIKKGDKILIYFKCSGTKYGNAMKFENDIEEKCRTLQPLSTDPAFERDKIYARRHVCKAKIGTVDTSHGKKMVFEFSLDKELPVEMVKKVLDFVKEFDSKFDEQFDKTESLNQQSNTNTATTYEHSTFDDTPEDTLSEEQPSNDSSGDNVFGIDL